MLLCYKVRVVLLDRSRSKKENMDRYLEIKLRLVKDVYIFADFFTLNGLIFSMLASLISEFLSSFVMRSRLTAAEIVLGIFFGG